MENTNSNLNQVRATFDTTRNWLVTRRHVLQFNTIILLIIVSLFVLFMSVGSSIQAFHAAHLPFSLNTPINDILVATAPILPISGFIGLLIFSYFTNLSQQDDSSRELMADGIILGIAALVPQAVFHIVWLATTYFIVTSRNYILTTEMFVNVNLEWVLSVAMVTAIGGLAWFLRSVLLDTTIIEHEAYDDYAAADDYQSRRVYE